MLASVWLDGYSEGLFWYAGRSKQVSDMSVVSCTTKLPAVSEGIANLKGISRRDKIFPSVKGYCTLQYCWQQTFRFERLLINLFSMKICFHFILCVLNMYYCDFLILSAFDYYMYVDKDKIYYCTSKGPTSSWGKKNPVKFFSTVCCMYRERSELTENIRIFIKLCVCVCVCVCGGS